MNHKGQLPEITEKKKKKSKIIQYTGFKQIQWTSFYAGRTTNIILIMSEVVMRCRQNLELLKCCCFDQHNMYFSGHASVLVNSTNTETYSI